MRGLNEKQKKFCEEYIKCGFNGAEAYHRAYGHEDRQHCSNEASRMLADSRILEELDRVENSFKLHIDWQPPKSQLMDLAIIFNLDILKLFIQKELVNDDDTKILDKNHNILLEYSKTLLEYHEKMLEKQNGL